MNHRPLAVVLILCCLATAVSADSGKRSNDGFKAIGMPIFFMITFILAAMLTNSTIRMAHLMASEDLAHLLLFRISVICSILSVFLYFSSAWAYGLIATCVCITTALAVASPDTAKSSTQLFIALAAWLGLLTGTPKFMGIGIIESINACDTYFNTYSTSMCKDGWLTFLEIVATIMMGMAMLSFLTVLSWVSKGSVEMPSIGRSSVGATAPVSTATGSEERLLSGGGSTAKDGAYQAIM